MTFSTLQRSYDFCIKEDVRGKNGETWVNFKNSGTKVVEAKGYIRDSSIYLNF